MLTSFMPTSASAPILTGAGSLTNGSTAFATKSRLLANLFIDYANNCSAFNKKKLQFLAWLRYYVLKLKAAEYWKLIQQIFPSLKLTSLLTCC